jgi:hypothetical protein
LPEEEPEEEAAHEHIGTSLDRGRDEPRPPPFERPPGHDAVRDREEEQEIAGETDRVQEEARKMR